MYEYQEYPRVMYHRTEQPVTVNSDKEREALGAGWEETPAAFVIDVQPEPFEAEAKPKPEAEAKPKRQKKDKPEE